MFELGFRASTLGVLSSSLVTLALAGCTGTNSFSHTSPSDYQYENEKTVDMSFEKAWDQYVSELSQSFFVINNIDKESRIINVSYSTQQPEEFVDCGSSKRTLEHPSVGTETYNYETAADSQFRAALEGTALVAQYQRNTSLEGRANIYMAPEENGTLLRTNVRYVWSVDVQGRAPQGRSYQSTSSVSFSTNRPGTWREQVGEKTFSTTCRTKGVLEERLLNLI